jgi:uncharacterized protein (TIGR03083 family)
MELDYPAIVERESAAMLTAVSAAPLSIRVPSCPDWDLGDLAIHMGGIQRWATHILKNAEPPSDGPPTSALEDAISFLADGTQPLVEALRSANPDDECWNFTRINMTKSFWSRRQAIEVVAHRWDAQDAVYQASGAGALEPERIEGHLAATAIDEWVKLLVPRMFNRSKPQFSELVGDVHIHCTDVPGEWSFEAIDGTFVVHDGHRKASAAVRGPASDVYLYLLNRASKDRVERFGNEALIDSWLNALSF